MDDKTQTQQTNDVVHYNYYDYFEGTGQLEDGQKKHCITINPTHNFKKLKEVRKKLFEKEKNKVIEIRNNDKIETIDSDINCLYIAWLKNELKVIKQWLSDTYPNGDKKSKQSKEPYSNQIEIMKYNDYVSKEIEITNKKIQKPSKQKKTSYVWQNNPDKELPELYNLMLNKYKLIALETTPEQFKAIFTGQTIDESFEPVRWHQDNASELLYFIGKLEQSTNIIHNPKKADYQKMTACFVTPDGKPFNAAWKSLKTNLEINLSLDKQNAINELVNNF